MLFVTPLFVLWRLTPSNKSNHMISSRLIHRTGKLFNQAFPHDCDCDPEGREMGGCCIGRVYKKLESHMSEPTSDQCLYVRDKVLIIPARGKMGRHSITSGPFHLGGARSITLAVRIAVSPAVGYRGSWSVGLLLDPDPSCGRSCSCTIQPGVPGLRIFGHDEGVKDVNGAPLAYPYHPEIKVDTVQVLNKFGTLLILLSCYFTGVSRHQSGDLFANSQR